MALTICPDCGKEHSDLATACPNCGRPNDPVQESKRPAAPRKKQSSNGCLFGSLLALGTVGAIGLLGSVLSKVEESKINKCNSGISQFCEALLDDSTFDRFDKITNGSYKARFQKKATAARKSAEPRAEPWDNTSAKVFCEAPIKQVLKDPESYQFASVEILETSGDSDQYGKAKIYFRARNGFGGYDMGSATCQAYDKSGERWFSASID